MSYTAIQLIAIAKAEIGYCEKASNSQLDDKTANAGSNNYTKFSRDLASAGYYNVNGLAWCAAFVAWCHHKASGNEIRNKTTADKYGVPFSGYASCPSCVTYYKNVNRFFTAPLPGDQIFFDYENDGRSNHTGIVCQIKNGKIYTIEGNSNQKVASREYDLKDPSILGYGRPLFADGPGDLFEYDETFEANIEAVQNATKHNFFEVTLKTISSTAVGFKIKTTKANKYDWEYQIIDLIRSTKTPAKKMNTSKLDNITIDNLIPYTPYSLKITAENDYLQSSQQVFFSTLQEKPSSVQNLVANFDMANKSCSVSFTPPVTWGNYAAFRTKGYRISLVINGKIVVFSDSLIPYKNTVQRVNKKISLADFKQINKRVNFNFTDILQIGIQAWVKDQDTAEIILDSSYPQCSQPLYLNYPLKPINNFHLKVLDNPKHTILWHNT